MYEHGNKCQCAAVFTLNWTKFLYLVKRHLLLFRIVSRVITAAKQGYVSLRLWQTQNLTVTVLMDYKFRAIWTTDLQT
jgi:hypothetical protein